MKHIQKYSRTLLALSAVLSFSLLSPKWLIPQAAWIAPFLLLMVTRNQKVLKGFLSGWVVLFSSGLLANYFVMPFPFLFMVLIVLKTSFFSTIPYFIYHQVRTNFSPVLAIIFFPCTAVAIEYISSFSGGGTWGVIGNTQAEYSTLIQIASVTGLWGISFLIYSCGSICFELWNTRFQSMVVRNAAILYVIVFVVIIAFGTLRIHPALQGPRETVRIAAITASNIEPLFQVYQDVFGKQLYLDPLALTQTSPELAELNRALAIFLEAPFQEKYSRSHQALEHFQDSLFGLAEKEAGAGAKLIVFSEALFFTFKPVEHQLIEKGKAFARTNRVRLLLTIGSFIPGKIEFGKKYIENKALMINETGEIDYPFFKNKPVPVIEGSVPGDGEIPVVKTDFGRVATSICYDADFPALMRRASAKNADLLLLPSGDWKEISPYHGNMARLRAVENGFSMIRPVSNATSIACNPFGEIIGSLDFFQHSEKILVVSVPTKSVFTLYSVIGDLFVYLSMAYCATLFGYLLFIRFLKRQHSLADER